MMISPQWALAIGIAISFVSKNNPAVFNKAKRWGTKLLQISVVLLGSSLNFNAVVASGIEGILLTFVSILFVFLAGYLGTKFLGIDKKLATLITMGTAICGGSAIGALAPVLAAESTTIAISLAIVFLLNALAVFIFPPVGAAMSLSQAGFGTWAAIAIHDTSSVVAASSLYGQEALAIATTIKLTRALWIIPVTVLFSLLSKTRNKITFPWFILGFLAMSLTFTYVRELQVYKELFLNVSKTGFAVTLFLIGLTFDLEKIKDVGARPFFFGVTLWLLITALSLAYVKGMQ